MSWQYCKRLPPTRQGWDQARRDGLAAGPVFHPPLPLPRGQAAAATRRRRRQEKLCQAIYRFRHIENSAIGIPGLDRSRWKRIRYIHKSVQSLLPGHQRQESEGQIVIYRFLRGMTCLRRPPGFSSQRENGDNKETYSAARESIQDGG